MKFAINLNEALGNLNKLPSGYKKLVQYTLKSLDTRWIGASENSEIEMLENVTGDKLAATLRKAAASKEKKIGFFIIANNNGYKLYIPQSDKISATAEFYIAAQETLLSYELDKGPTQPKFVIKRGSGRNSSWKPIRLRDVLSLEADAMYSLYVVYQDPVAVDKGLKRNEWDGNPDPLGSSDLFSGTRTMNRLKSELPAHKASKLKIVDFNTLTVSELAKLLKNAPKKYSWRNDDILISVKGFDEVCEFSPADKLDIQPDGIVVGTLKPSYKILYLTTTGFVLK